MVRCDEFWYGIGIIELNYSRMEIGGGCIVGLKMNEKKNKTKKKPPPIRVFVLIIQ